MSPAKHTAIRLLLMALLLAGACGDTGRARLRPFPDRPPLLVDDDRRPLRATPHATPRTPLAARLAHQIVEPMDRWLRAGVRCPARNVNALGQVPRSTWFRPETLGDAPHRRSARRRLTGRLAARPPSLLAPWAALRWARDGAGPWVDIRDEHGARFRLRFDAPGAPRLATTAAFVSAQLLTRLGYRVPEKHLVIFSPNQITRGGCDPARPLPRPRRPRGRRAPPCWPSALTRLLARVRRETDGSLRAVATRLRDEVPLGPFRYHATRPGDPNDFVDHALRRELRGLRAVAAWLNLTGITGQIPEDAFDPGARVVRHRLGGLGGGLRGALGSTRIGAPKPLSAGFVSVLSLPRVLAQLVTLGNLPRPWARLRARRARLVRKWPGVGWLPVAAFHPRQWRPRLENPAFALADAQDLHWAARRIARLSPRLLRRIVEETFGPAGERRRLLGVLLARRREVLRAYLPLRAPLGAVRFHLRSRRLCVTDLWRLAGLSRSAPSSSHSSTTPLEVRVRAGAALRPQPGVRTPIHASRVCLALPPPTMSRRRWGAYAVIELRRPDVSARWLRVHFRFTPRSIRLLGVEW